MRLPWFSARSVQVMDEVLPDYVRVLTGKRIEDEPEVKVGIWVVAWLPIWSHTSRMIRPNLVEMVRPHQNRVKLGLYVMESGIEDMWAWWDAVERDIRDPAVLFLKDGELVWQGAGYMNSWQLREKLERCFPELR